MAITQTTQIDPVIQPYLSYGLQQAQQQYQAGGPQYYPGQTFVAPSVTSIADNSKLLSFAALKMRCW